MDPLFYASASEFHLNEHKNIVQMQFHKLPNKQQNKLMALVIYTHTSHTLHYTSKSNVLFVLCEPIFHAFLCRIQFKFTYKFQLILSFCCCCFASLAVLLCFTRHLWQSIINVQIESKLMQKQKHINVEPVNISIIAFQLKSEYSIQV